MTQNWQRLVLLLERLEGRHVQILQVARCPREWLTRHGHTTRAFNGERHVEHMLMAYPEYQERQDALHEIWEDLWNFRLVQFESLEDKFSPRGPSRSSMWTAPLGHVLTTPLGTELIHFITDPVYPPECNIKSDHRRPTLVLGTAEGQASDFRFVTPESKEGQQLVWRRDAPPEIIEEQRQRKARRTGERRLESQTE